MQSTAYANRTLKVWVSLLVALSILAWPPLLRQASASTTPSTAANNVEMQNLGATTSVLLKSDSTWKYLDNGSDQGTGWIAPGFNDSAWRSGAAQLGYGDGDEATRISFGSNARDKYITYYFRSKFTVSNAALYTALNFNLARDDGAVVYLNDREVIRSNMPTGTIGYRTLASKAGTSEFNNHSVDPRLLVNGTNTIAVEVHQVERDSSDLSFALEVSGTATTPTAVPTNTPTQAPTATPTTVPTSLPSATPTTQPTLLPTQPGVNPTTQPTVQPTLTTSSPSSGTFLPANATWKFLDNGSDQGTAWTSPGFNDGAWRSGPAQLGYGDGDEATVVSFGSNASSKYITTYFRASFNASSVANLGELVINLIRDDGAVLYLNGREAARTNMPTGTITYRTLASAAGNGTPVQLRVDPRLLVEGTNTIAVEIHQVSGSSSDISFAMEIIGNVIAPGGVTSATPVATATPVVATPTAAPTLPPTPAATNPANGLMIAGNAAWKYLDNGSDQGTAWTSPSFSDVGWAFGPAQLGYGDGDEATTVGFGGNASSKFITTYFRHSFTLADPSVYTSLMMKLVRDDGAVVYINGTEALRTNLPAGAVNYRTVASTAGDNGVQQFSVNPRLLVAGTNVVAVEIHQVQADSSDISFAMELVGGTGAVAPTPAPTLQPTPAPISPSTGSMFFVAPNGSSSGTGSESSPWNLQTALSHPAAVRPGATIWVRGGTYRGSFISNLNGSSTGYITVRAFPGERAILDGTDKVLTMRSTSYVNFWGLEVTNSANRRTITTSPGGNDGVLVDQGYTSHHIKFINMIVHDVAGQGFAWWVNQSDSEIYGSLIYYNGVNQFDHGIYTQNRTGAKKILNNMIFDNASHGISAYGSSSSYLNNFTIDGNTVFSNGSTGYNTAQSDYSWQARNILMGGGSIAQNPVVTNNSGYYPAGGGTNLNVGYGGGSNNGRVQNNYIGNAKVAITGTTTNLTVSGNTFYYSALDGFSASQYPSNTWQTTRPTGIRSFVRPNAYEPGRANVTIFNWDRTGTVQISASQLSGVQIQSGDRYELHNVQNYFGDVVTGTYNGSSLSVPMTGHSVAQPTGLSFKPPTTFPEFGAFILVVIGQ